MKSRSQRVRPLFQTLRRETRKLCHERGTQVSEQTVTNAANGDQEQDALSPRSPIRAVVLSLLMFGLGHVYCGQLTTGLIWAAVGALGGVISLWALATQETNLVAASLPMWVISVVAAIHAWWSARNCPADYRLKSYNRWYVYVLLLLISSVGVVGHGLLIRSNLVEAYVTPSADMHPTFQVGDRFLVDKTAYRNEPVHVGDLVVFKNPANRRRTYIKRVVALAEDKIEIRGGQLLVNDGPVGDSDPAVDDFGPLTVPKYNCFVLGDDRPKSRDSRHFGPVPEVAVLGRATMIYWPQGSWSRFGRVE